MVHINSKNGEMYSLYRAYLELIFGDIENLKNGKKEVLDPWILKKLIGQKDAMFASYRQQDAHELLSFLLNALHDEMYKAILSEYGFTKKKKINSKQEADYDDKFNDDDDVDMEKDIHRIT